MPEADQKQILSNGNYTFVQTFFSQPLADIYKLSPHQYLIIHWYSHLWDTEDLFLVLEVDETWHFAFFYGTESKWGKIVIHMKM